MNDSPRLLIVGCGYLGTEVARLASHSGVIVTTRSRVQQLRAKGLDAVRFDWNDSRDLPALAEVIRHRKVDRIAITISYDRKSCVDRFVSQVDHLARFLRMLKSVGESDGTPIPSVAYISTTGVYHQTGGVWVDENSTTRPTREGGITHLRAESKLHSVLGQSSPWGILRLAGIYGPGRVPRAADVRAGRPIKSPPDGYLNLIHVHDAARATLAWFSTQTETDRQRHHCYCICDDAPVIRKQFYKEIARQTGSPSPTFISPDEDAGVRFRSETNKRVSNRAMKRDLLPRLLYPSYVEGLRSIL